MSLLCCSLCDIRYPAYLFADGSSVAKVSGDIVFSNVTVCDLFLLPVSLDRSGPLMDTDVSTGTLQPLTPHDITVTHTHTLSSQTSQPESTSMETKARG
jgi:hypothetical protein